MTGKSTAMSVWLVQPTSRKIAKGTIDRGLIASHAAQLLDESGLEAFTMRALGRRLGVSAMAFYAHVRHKDDVLELAQDHVMGALQVAPGPWDAILRQLADDYRRLLVAHSWLPTLAGRYLNAGPNVTSMTTQAAIALSNGGLPPRLITASLSAVLALAHGHGAIEAAWMAKGTQSELDDLTRQLAQRSPQDPVLAFRAESGTSTSSAAEWTFALDCLLLGISRRILENG
ncbi:TPA: TetR family transcriptional regulator [Pseudomonas aeruginosa]|nr:TetR family transcriptional regulator [Pseudomonas aeruginosa]HEK0165618.1 TetR family transcriptional regulator [Pseudomonas aeruginosa]